MEDIKFIFYASSEKFPSHTNIHADTLTIGSKNERFEIYGPFKNISLISSLSLIRGGPGEKPPDLPVQNLASHMYPSEGRTTAVTDPMFRSQRS